MGKKRKKNMGKKLKKEYGEKRKKNMGKNEKKNMGNKWENVVYLRIYFLMTNGASLLFTGVL